MRANVAPGATIIYVSSRTCSMCRAMEPDLEGVVGIYGADINFQFWDVERDLDEARLFGVKSTPTLIGLRDDREVIRVTGRRSRAQLEELVEAVIGGERGWLSNRHDAFLRIGAGTILVAIGALSSEAWPLLILGVGSIAWGVASGTKIRND